MEWFIVLILIGGMLSLELVNAAIERVVDLDNDGMASAGQASKRLSCWCSPHLCDCQRFDRYAAFHSKMV